MQKINETANFCSTMIEYFIIVERMSDFEKDHYYKNCI